MHKYKHISNNSHILYICTNSNCAIMTDNIQKTSTPLHAQAEKYLRELIATKEYQNGKLLPSEIELSKVLGISRNTLRLAINKLMFEGLLDRRKGVGTKVVRKGIVSSAQSWLSFSEEMKRLGVNVRNYELHISRKKANNEVNEFFRTKDEDTRFLTLERVRGNESYPFVCFISYFNPEIKLTGNEDFARPLYELLEKDFGVTVKTSKEEISARLAGEIVAEKLEIKPTDPILIRKRCVYDVTGKPIEYNLGFYRADSFTYSVESER